MVSTTPGGREARTRRRRRAHSRPWRRRLPDSAHIRARCCLARRNNTPGPHPGALATCRAHLDREDGPRTLARQLGLRAIEGVTAIGRRWPKVAGLFPLRRTLFIDVLLSEIAPNNREAIACEANVFIP